MITGLITIGKSYFDLNSFIYSSAIFDACLIGLLQLTITWYKIRHAGGQAHYYSPTGTLKQRQVKLDWFRSLCFNVPVGE